MANYPNFTAELSNVQSVRNAAQSLGYVQTRGKQAGQGSIRQLLEAIGRGEVNLSRTNTQGGKNDR